MVLIVHEVVHSAVLMVLLLGLVLLMTHAHLIASLAEEDGVTDGALTLAFERRQVL